MECQKGCKHHNLHLADCSDKECGGCLPKQAENGLQVCPNCVAKFAAALTDLLRLYPALEGRMFPSTDYSARERVQENRTPGMELNWAVMDVKSKLRSWLSFVERIVVTEAAPVAWPLSPAIGDLIDFAYKHRQWLLAHELAGDFVGDAASLLHSVKSVVAPVMVQRTQLPGETCGASVGDGVCDGGLVVVLREQGATRKSYAKCAKDATHTPTRRQPTTVSAKTVLSAGEAGRLLDLESNQLGAFAIRYEWQTMNVDGHRIYQLADVMNVLIKRGGK